MTSNDPRSTDFSYKKYSLEQLDNWVNDALNCEDLTPEDIYDTIVNVVDESIEYHKKHLTKSIELLSLLKGNRQVDFDYTATGEKFPITTEATNKDWVDFWEEPSKDQVREYNLKEQAYYDARAKLDADYAKELEEIRKDGGYEWTPGT